MPINYQETMISLYKENDVVKGRSINDILLENEEYFMSIILQLPEDDININIGNFEVEVSFAYDNGENTSLKNMGLLKYYSPITRMCRLFLRMPMILLGIIDESQYVKVDFYHSFNNSKDIKEITINIIPIELRIYSLTMNFQVQLKGLRKFMFNYFFTSFIIGSFSIFLMLVSTFLIIFSLYYEYPTNQEETIQVEYIIPKETPIDEPPDFSMIIKPQKKQYSISRFFAFS